MQFLSISVAIIDLFNVSEAPGLMYCRFCLKLVFVTVSVCLYKAQSKTKLKYSWTFYNVNNFLLA